MQKFRESIVKDINNKI